MTDQLTIEDLAALTKFQKAAYATARAKGFQDVPDRLKGYADTIRDVDPEVADLMITSLYGNQFLLVVSELIEAQDELRHGRAVDETYYPEGNKPEGVPSEMADVMIRMADIFESMGVDSGAIIGAKMGYNQTRELRHGGKKF